MAEKQPTGPAAPGMPKLDKKSIEEASKEAEERPLDFDPKTRATYVRAMIQRVAEFQKAGRSTEQIKQLLPEFAEEYKHLFEMITSPEPYDPRDLQLMLSLLDKMGRGDVNQHKASIAVGQRLVQKYVKPSVEPPARGAL